jgi:nitroimidazol reductase NimA-like FMN-containing flavoprotein (pyridoxamine 5'-phosphate oxidase superfamily)
MFKEMRRKDKQISKEAAEALLMSGLYGILATADGDCMPYALPISYVYLDGHIYFHCAKKGHKLDNINANSKVSFCVIGDTKVLPDKFSTTFQSTVIFGRAQIVENTDEKYKVLFALIDKYSSEYKKEGKEYIEKAASATTVVRIDIEHITGKGRNN